MSLKESLDRFVKDIQDTKGIKAVYAVDLDKMELSKKFLHQEYNQATIKEIIKSTATILNAKDTENILIETKSERIFIGGLKDKFFLIIVADKVINIGSLFAMLKKIKNNL